MSTPCISTIQTNAAKQAELQLIAYNNRDIDAFLDCYSDDIELIDKATNTVFCKGIQQMRERYAPMFEEKIDLRCDVIRRVVCGNFAIDEEHVYGLSPSGDIVHAVAIYEAPSDKIIRAWFIRGESV